MFTTISILKQSFLVTYSSINADEDLLPIPISADQTFVASSISSSSLSVYGTYPGATRGFAGFDGGFVLEIRPYMNTALTTKVAPITK